MLFVFQFYPVGNFGTSIKFRLGTVRSERVKMADMMVWHNSTTNAGLFQLCYKGHHQLHGLSGVLDMLFNKSLRSLRTKEALLSMFIGRGGLGKDQC